MFLVVIQQYCYGIINGVGRYNMIRINLLRRTAQTEVRIQLGMVRFPAQQLFTGCILVTPPIALTAAGVVACSAQSPLQLFLHEHSPSGQLQSPPQHSNLGKLTRPNAAPRSPVTLAAAGYAITFIGSIWAPIWRLTGGDGSAAARAKNRSMMLELLKFIAELVEAVADGGNSIARL